MKILRQIIALERRLKLLKGSSDVFDTAKLISDLLGLKPDQQENLLDVISLNWYKPIDISFLRRDLGDLLPGIINDTARLFDMEVVEFYPFIQKNSLSKRRWLPIILKYYYGIHIAYKAKEEAIKHINKCKSTSKK